VNPDHVLSVIPTLSREESKVLLMALAEHMRAIDLGKVNPVERAVLSYTAKRLPVNSRMANAESPELQRSAELFEKCWEFEG
jgi:hypothetical protein